MTKSITTTFHRSYNYGATLQAYALQQTLLDLGFENKILDFYRDPFEKKPLFSGDFKKDAISIVLRILGYIHRKEKIKLVEGFDYFTQRRLLLTKMYNSYNELCVNPPYADCYITGSDQIFALREPEYVVKRNMLAFVDAKSDKYSYAASLSDYDLNAEEKAAMKSFLSDFKSISVREEEAASYLESFIGKQCIVNIDPVLLMEKSDWETIAVKPAIKEPYILYFQVNSNPIAKEVLRKVSENGKYLTVCLQTSPFIRVRTSKAILDASPEEFLGYLLAAKQVVTTSFHGTAFSILFHKDFVTLTKCNSNPVRMVNLLRLFGLESHLITDIKDLKKVLPVEWMEVEKQREVLKKEAINYLKGMKIR